MIDLALLPAHERLAELYDTSRARTLTKMERSEMVMCLQVNASVMREIGMIRTISIAASDANDVKWQHEICERIEKVAKKFIGGGVYSG